MNVPVCNSIMQELSLLS